MLGRVCNVCPSNVESNYTFHSITKPNVIKLVKGFSPNLLLNLNDIHLSLRYKNRDNELAQERHALQTRANMTRHFKNRTPLAAECRGGHSAEK